MTRLNRFAMKLAKEVLMIDTFDPPRDLEGSVLYAISFLDDVERTIIWYRYALNKTPEQIAMKMKFQLRDVTATECTALIKLREEKSKRYIQFGMDRLSHMSNGRDDIMMRDALSLGLSTRVETAFRRHQIYTVADILDALRSGRLLRINGLGATSRKEITNKLNELGVLNTPVTSGV